MTFSESTKDAMRVFLENMVGSSLLAKEVGLDVDPSRVVNTTIDQIIKIAEETLPLSRIMDSSDIVLHAEGPGAAHGMPWLSALNWMCSTAESNIRRLSSAVFDLAGGDGKRLAKRLDLRLPGIAPGSVWIGVKIVPPQADLIPEDGALMESIAGQIHNLPALVRFIDDEELRPGIEEAVPDPALRDIQLAALYRFSPSGRRGIHTLELSSKDSGAATLSQRERVVLKEAIDKPSIKQSREGSFIGFMQEADLDKTRLHLRGVPNIGTLRCVMPSLTVAQARAMFGGLVRAEGHYQCDKDGRPRLLFVERITALEQGELQVTT
ncbi:hypothetical protein DFR40_0960 [Azonexus fungiphilus]|uniref:Uncharacterized protein n=1 Tax=Azonexus fungiphilus TaxID=146940 RepID=A0A495WJL6_9RHOO|nr:hypothetical protein [Azonexus fungiphilus]RKT60813.1 hypothetical protein DFR40_0960 [Azonexus fungiphilus]